MTSSRESQPAPPAGALPPALARVPEGNGARCVVLVDGEHYPPAVRDAIGLLGAAGWRVEAAALVGGGEKLRDVPSYGVPHLTPPGDDPGPAGALRAALGAVDASPEGPVGTIVDLADEPVLVPDVRMSLIGLAASRGLRFVTADTVVEAPAFSRISVPTLAILGTGKRIGKTAVSAYCARTLDAHLGGNGAVVVVAMGRGGPAEPVVVDRADGAITVERLLAISREGRHAASDYLEGAALTGLTTVGCRRVSGGLLGVPAASNVPEGAQLAAGVSPQPRLVVLEGSGSCVPPVHADAALLLGSTERPEDLLTGLGPYRLGLADVVLVMGDDADAGRAACESVRCVVGDRGDRPLTALAATLVPTPVGPVAGRRVAAFTTAPDHIGPRVRRELESHGADVVHVSCNLARRGPLADDLDAARSAGADLLVVEIKAAAIDAVAEFASRHSLAVSFLDNLPVLHAGEGDTLADHVTALVASIIE